MGGAVVIAIVLGLVVAMWLVLRLARRGSSATTARSYRPAPSLPPDVAAQAWQLDRDGQKIQAIKLVREHTGLGLREAKDAVESLSRGPAPSDETAAAPAQPPLADADGEPVFGELELVGLRALVADGQKIEAIRLVRERTGLGLREAKDYVEGLG